MAIINMDAVEEARSLMLDRFPMMVSYFLEDVEMYCREIERARTEKNVSIAVAAAHTIKSSAKQLGVERVSDVAKAIEELCRNMLDTNDTSKFSSFEELCKQLTEAMSEATPELKRLCK